MMEHGRIRFVAGASVERIGPEVLVSVPGRCEAFRLSGEAARLAIAVLDGTPIPDSDPLVVDELHRRGIVEIAGPTRRSLLRASGIAAGAGIAVLSLPSVAAAASGGGADRAGEGEITLNLVGSQADPFTGFVILFKVNMVKAGQVFSVPVGTVGSLEVVWTDPVRGGGEERTWTVPVTFKDNPPLQFESGPGPFEESSLALHQESFFSNSGARFTLTFIGGAAPIVFVP